MLHSVVASGEVAENAYHFKIFLFCLKLFQIVVSSGLNSAAHAFLRVEGKGCHGNIQCVLSHIFSQAILHSCGIVRECNSHGKYPVLASNTCSRKSR